MKKTKINFDIEDKIIKFIYFSDTDSVPEEVKGKDAHIAPLIDSMGSMYGWVIFIRRSSDVSKHAWIIAHECTHIVMDRISYYKKKSIAVIKKEEEIADKVADYTIKLMKEEGYI